MFEHSVRVPRHFKIAANIVQKVSEEGGSVKTLLYDNKLKHFRTSVLYALINESIKHAVDIEKMFESTGVLVNEPRLDPWLAKVLTAELIFGKKLLPGKSKPEQTIISYRERFEKCAPEVLDDDKSKVVRRPRYVRINTNLLTTSDAIGVFQDDGYKFIRCTSGSYNDYLQQIQNLTEYDFTQDYHVKTIFVFSPGTKLHEHDLYLENKIILQDKATALAVHLLAAPSGSTVLDMCAAPGMKTTQLAAYLRNQGKIYAVERNEKRYETLCQYVEATGSKCVETIHKDSLEIRRGDLDDVEYILLDPSCSGSGMELSVHNYIDETRLAKLTSLQEKFLKHAMNSFPNAKRIVYSTCSMFPEENERVVTNIVKASRAKWRVKDIKELLKEQWNNYGSGMYGSMGTRCLYAKTDTDFTIGFFVAVLDRDLRDIEKQQDENKVASSHNKLERTLEQCDTTVLDNKPLKKNKTKKSSDIEHAVNSEELSELMNDENNVLKSKKKKQSKVIEISEDKYEVSYSKKKKVIPNADVGGEEIISVDSKASDDLKSDTLNNKKKHKNKSIEILDLSAINKSFENNDEIEIPKKKKKKHKERENESLETVTVVETKEIVNKKKPETDISLENKHEKEFTKKLKKKCKDYENESLEVVSGTTIDVSSNIDQEKTAKKVSKSKKGTLMTLETEKEQLNSSYDIETFKNNQVLGNVNTLNEVPKTHKKKKKLRDEVDQSFTNTILTDDVIDNSNSKSEKKIKTKKKDPDYVNSDASLCDLTQESDKNGTEVKDGFKRKKSDLKDLEITEKNLSCEVPKKKKKKRESEIS